MSRQQEDESSDSEDELDDELSMYLGAVEQVNKPKATNGVKVSTMGCW